MRTETMQNEQQILTNQLAFPRTLSIFQEAAARALEGIGEHGEARPDALMPKREHLDRLLQNQLEGEELDEVADWTWWVGHFERAMSHWKCLWWYALAEMAEAGGQFREQQISSCLAEIRTLTAAAYAAFAEAAEENFKDLTGIAIEDSSPATIELARRYRRLTRYVEDLVLKVWPGLSRDLLFNGGGR